MSEAAKGIRIVGSGEQIIREAIQSGMMTVEATRAYKQVLADNERLRRVNRDLRMQVQVYQRSRAVERKCKAEAYRMVLAKDSDYQRDRDWRVAYRFGLVTIGALVMALATLIVVLAA